MARMISVHEQVEPSASAGAAAVRVSRAVRSPDTARILGTAAENALNMGSTESILKMGIRFRDGDVIAHIAHLTFQTLH